MSIINLEEKFEAGKKDVLYFEVLIKGTKISVRETLRQMSIGTSTDDILKANPGMIISDIYTCLTYAWELVGAIDFRKAVSAVNIVDKKRKAFLEKLESMRANPDQFLKYFPGHSEEKSDEKKAEDDE